MALKKEGAMSGYTFKTNLFSSDFLVQQRASSDGYGLEFAQWLQPQLEAQGYQIHVLEEDACGWSMVVQLEPFKLFVSCFVVDAGAASNFEALKMPKDAAAWMCFVGVTEPFFKSLFKKINTDAAVQKLDEDLKAILVGEPSIHFIPDLELDSPDHDD